MPGKKGEGEGSEGAGQGYLQIISSVEGGDVVVVVVF